MRGRTHGGEILKGWRYLRYTRWRERTRSAPKTLAAIRASRAGPKASPGGAAIALLRLPPETPKTPNTCLPGKKLCARSVSPAARPWAKPVKPRRPLRATRSKPLTSSTPAEAGRAPHPSRGPAAPPRPRGRRPTGRLREYSRRPRAACGRRWGDERPGTPRGGGAAGQGAGAGPGGRGRAPPRLVVPSRARRATVRTLARLHRSHVTGSCPIAMRPVSGRATAPVARLPTLARWSLVGRGAVRAKVAPAPSAGAGEWKNEGLWGCAESLQKETDGTWRPVWLGGMNREDRPGCLSALEAGPQVEIENGFLTPRGFQKSLVCNGGVKHLRFFS